MMPMPPVEAVLSRIGRDPAQLSTRPALVRGRSRRQLMRGSLGVVLGLVLVALGATGSVRWHWAWLLLLATGLLLLAAGVHGVALTALRARAARRTDGERLVTDYVRALGEALDAAGPTGPTGSHLELAKGGEAPDAALRAVRASGLFPHATGARVDDLLIGSVAGVPFEIRELAVEHAASYPAGGSGRRVAFDGLLTLVHLPEPLDGAVQIIARGCGPALSGGDVGLAPVPTGDAAFDRVFEVCATAPEHALRVDGPLRERLLRLHRDARIDDMAILFEGETVRCAVADAVDMFEAGEGDLLAQLETIHEELALCLRVVDLLAGTGTGTDDARRPRTQHPASPDRAPRAGGPRIIGHRGAARLEAENTLRSFRRAIAAGADGIECDVHLSADGHVVVLHDETLERTADPASPRRSGAVAELSRAELDEVRLAHGQPIPSLDDVLALVQEADHPVQAVIEVKAPAAAEAVARTLLERFPSEAWSDRDAAPALVISFHPEALLAVRSCAAHVPVGLVVRECIPETARLLADLDAEALCVGIAGATTAAAEMAHREGRRLNVWTVNEPDQLSRALVLGADSITSDDPAWVREELERARRA